MTRPPASSDRYDHAVFALQYERSEGEASNHGDIEHYVAALAGTDGPVLELGCGTGRVTLPLARAGVDVTGLDAAAAMVELARHKAAAAGLSPTFVVADAVTYRARRDFRAALFAYNSLCMIEPERLEAFAANLRDLLLPGGRFLFDVSRSCPARFDSRGRRESPWSEPLALPELGVTLRRRITLVADPAERRIDTVYEWDLQHADGRREARCTVLPFSDLEPEEYVEILAGAGFELVGLREVPFERGGLARRHCFVELALPPPLPGRR